MIPQRIVALGTSVFFGIGDPLHGGYIGRLKVWHENQDEDNAVFNLGISGATVGETTSQLLERLGKEVAVREPHLILLTSGINDIRRPGSPQNPSVIPPERFTENIEEMIHKARVLADVIWISVCPIRDKHDSSNNYLLATDLKDYAQITKQVCEENNIPYLDIYNEWVQTSYNHLLTEDGVHPNGKGHEEIFKQLKNFLIAQYQHE